MFLIFYKHFYKRFGILKQYLGDIVSFSSSKIPSYFSALLALPLVVLFQNCGSASSDGGSGSKKSGDAEYYRNHTSSGLRGAGGSNTSTGSSGGGSGTFSFSDGSGGGSGGTGGFSGGGSGNAESSGAGSGSSSMPFDGRNCYKGSYALDQNIIRSYDRSNNKMLQALRNFVAYGPTRTVGMPMSQMDFPDARSGDTFSVSCEVAKEKLRVFFPPAYFTSQYVEMDNSRSVTAFQCRSGFWYFAGTSCKWMLYTDFMNQGNNGP